ncbi:hypothetical protein ES288_D09G143500v1 [Gossypium darwinii]|uniref:Uncharacterized protein n=2 Tax=Gossypium TaxID=3633 RepID=A0A5D2JJ17_GOSTO|nr:hypothetical protein ES288_D09G143500v1 [Gossypium darwinii]TYH54023.1 hypothetical protein ES332_D09G139600v1 [Gossypium tomentosum]
MILYFLILRFYFSSCVILLCMNGYASTPCILVLCLCSMHPCFQHAQAFPLFANWFRLDTTIGTKLVDINTKFRNKAGQSFACFLTPGMNIQLIGEANDFGGKLFFTEMLPSFSVG